MCGCEQNHPGIYCQAVGCHCHDKTDAVHPSHEITLSRDGEDKCCRKCGWLLDHDLARSAIAEECKPKPEIHWLPLRPVEDDVNHPSHYTAYKGLEIIQLTEQMNFCRGNAVKYIARAGLKNPDDEIKDLEKAKWYIQREIERVKKESDDQ